MPTGSDWFRDSYRFENGFRRTTLSRIELATLRSYDFFGQMLTPIANLHRQTEIRDIEQLIAACKVFFQADGCWEEFGFCFDAICYFARMYFCLFREKQKTVSGLPEDWDPDLFDDAARRRNNARRRRENREGEQSTPNWDEYHSSFRQDRESNQAHESPNEAETSVIQLSTVTAPSSVALVRKTIKPVEGEFMIRPDQVIAFRVDCERFLVNDDLFLRDNIVYAKRDSDIVRRIRHHRKRKIPMQIDEWGDFMEEWKDESVSSEDVEIMDVVPVDVDMDTKSDTIESANLGSLIFGDDYRNRDFPPDIRDQPHLDTFLAPRPTPMDRTPSISSLKSATSSFDVSRDAVQETRVPDYSAQPLGYQDIERIHRQNQGFQPPDVGTRKRSDRSSFSKRKLKQSSRRRSCKYLARSATYAWSRRFRASNVLNP
jgi:hypothetical protein